MKPLQVAYDLDGVLAEGPPPSEKPWGRMNGTERKTRQDQLLQAYAQAKRLFEPPESRFLVISARKESPQVRVATVAWLDQHFPGRYRLFLLTKSRTLKNVIAFKAAVLQSELVLEFTEDNRQVLQGIHQASPNKPQLWLYEHPERRPFP